MMEFILEALERGVQILLFFGIGILAIGISAFIMSIIFQLIEKLIGRDAFEFIGYFIALVFVILILLIILGGLTMDIDTFRIFWTT